MALHPSPRCAALLFLGHMLAALAVYATHLPPLAGVTLFLLVLLSLAYHLVRDALLLLPASWCSLSIDDGVATILVRDGSRLTGRIAGGSVVTSAFVILRIQPDGARWPVARTIFPDALEPDAYRELCVRLRYLY